MNMNIKINKGQIIVLNNFTNLDSREEFLLSTLKSEIKSIIIDTTKITTVASKDIYDDIVFFARITKEYINRHNQSAPKIVIVYHDNHLMIDRFNQINSKANLNLGFAISMNEAKAKFGNVMKWETITLT